MPVSQWRLTGSGNRSVISRLHLLAKHPVLGQLTGYPKDMSATPTTIDAVMNILMDECTQMTLDVYYTNGYPELIHELGDFHVAKFGEILRNKIKVATDAITLWKVSSEGYAVVHSEDNPDAFSINYEGVIVPIRKKVITIKESA